MLSARLVLRAGDADLNKAKITLPHSPHPPIQGTDILEEETDK